MTTTKLLAGDNRDRLRQMIDDGVRVHSVVTDPPYGLVSIQKRFGKKGAVAAKSDGNDGSFSRLSGGFMGKAWDGTEIERDPEFWKLVYDVLLPGGCVFAFGGSRTVHWQMVAMEQAGFVIHPMHIWAFGSGFPKAHAADKAIDKALGAERQVVGVSERGSGAQPNKLNNHGKGDTGIGYADGSGRVFEITRAATPEAQQWEGWAYGTQTQKPALEPIVLAQKPFSEKTGAANLLKHGVGAFNIDGCRVPGAPEPKRFDPTIHKGSVEGWRMNQTGADQAEAAASRKGRHPANLLHDGSPEVVALFPDSKGQQGKSADANRSQVNTYGATTDNGKIYEPRNDSGSAARFFNCFPPDADPVFYHPKAGKVDRAGSKHPTVKPVALLQHLIRHITPPGGTVLDPFAGSGTTAEAARREGFDCIIMEKEDEYVEFLKERFPDAES